jgi:hypothetical protein
MSDLFTKLIRRSQGSERVVRPRLPGLFEPTHFDVRGWGEIDEELAPPENAALRSTQASRMPLTSHNRQKSAELMPSGTPFTSSLQPQLGLEQRQQQMPRDPEAVPQPMKKKTDPQPPALRRTTSEHHHSEFIDTVVRTHMTEVQRIPTDEALNTPTLQDLMASAHPDNSKVSNPQQTQLNLPPSPITPLPSPKRLRPTRQSSGGSRKVEVRIGNIEVRSAQPGSPTAPKRAARPGPKTSLNDYLARRSESRR